jgi:hypothetical protein
MKGVRVLSGSREQLSLGSLVGSLWLCTHLLTPSVDHDTR